MPGTQANTGANISPTIRDYEAGNKIMRDLDKAEIGKNKNDRMSESMKAAELEKAFNYFTSSCGEDSNFALAFYKRGKCYMMMHDYKRALYDFSAAFFNQDKNEHKQP